MTDTTTEAVERVASELEACGWKEDGALIRALAQERDAAVKAWETRQAIGAATRKRLTAERDAARAVAKRLQAELRSVLGRALAEKAPLRAQEIASIRAALAATEGKE